VISSPLPDYNDKPTRSPIFDWITTSIIFWLRDESLEESDNLPDPDVLDQEIVEDLEAALEQFHEIAKDLDEKS
jgi:hypothetical protein